LISIGIDISKYSIYFSYDSKISKAEYIDKFINTSIYSQVYFIDDISLISKQVKKNSTILNVLFTNIIDIIF